MKKFALPAVSILCAALFFYFSFLVARLKEPGQTPGYAIGFALGGLFMPFLVATLAAWSKKAFNKEKTYDWTLFHWFVVGFCLVSGFGKFGEYQQLQHPEPSEQTVEPGRH